MRFELDQFHRNVPDDILTEDVRAVAARLRKRSITINEYRENGKFHPSTIIHRMGGWPVVLRRAGLEVEHYNGGAPVQEAFRDLQAAASHTVKDTVTQAEFRRHSKFGPKVLIRHYGSWFAALAAAGLAPSRRLKVSEEDLFCNMEKMWCSLGRQPRYQEVVKPFSDFSKGTYERHFGSWGKALEAFVCFINSPQTEQAETADQAPCSALKIDGRIRRKKTPRTPNWRLRFLVMRRDCFRCTICGATQSSETTLEVDHIDPYSGDGETVYENLHTLCQKCNAGKSNLSLRSPASGSKA